ncbi:MAG: PEP-CTERM sorting domain-containing protein [Verrucomicrobiales bacterium]|nr:PEP-CTERM sorting domain-containing protein [Verrucomicrobiales bacterium]
MKIRKQLKKLAVGMAASTRIHLCILGVLGFAGYSASGQTTYTDTQGDAVASTLPANGARDIWSATINNDAANFYITLNLNSGANVPTTGFNYGIGITTGNPTAGGDTSANTTTHGNAYGRAISIDSSLGGMMAWIGIFGAGGSGTAAVPYTSYGFNVYSFGTPGAVGITNGGWTKIDQVNSGQPFTATSISITVPMIDLSANLSLTPGTTLFFDIYSTGGSGNQTAYDSLANPSPTQPLPYNGTLQYNGTVLDSYTIVAVPEPTTLTLLGLSGLVAIQIIRRERRLGKCSFTSFSVGGHPKN